MRIVFLILIVFSYTCVYAGVVKDESQESPMSRMLKAVEAGSPKGI